MFQELRRLRSVINRMEAGTFQREWWDNYFWFHSNSIIMLVIVMGSSLGWLLAQIFGLPYWYKVAFLSMVAAAGCLHFLLNWGVHSLKRQAPDQE